MNSNSSPDDFVRENRETIVRIIKHSDNEFVRAICLKALVRYGGDPSLQVLQQEVERAGDEEGGDSA